MSEFSCSSSSLQPPTVAGGSPLKPKAVTEHAFLTVPMGHPSGLSALQDKSTTVFPNVIKSMSSLHCFKLSS